MPKWNRIRTAGDILSAIAATAVLIAVIAPGRLSSDRRTGSADDDERIPDWRQRFAIDAPELTPGPSVEIVEFIDYQCPPCRQLNTILNTMQAQYGSQMAVHTVQFPLPQHKFAIRAANSAECARRQGRFRQMHELLYSNTRALAELGASELARLAGVTNVADFARCASESDTLAEVRRSIEIAKQLRLPGTPAILVNGVLLRAVPSAARLSERVERVLREHSNK